MTSSLFILGRQPSLGLAELESLYGPKVLKPLAAGLVMADVAPGDIDFKRLGGSVKLCTLLNILDTISWEEIEKYLSKMIPEHLKYIPEGKFKLGLSVYGLGARTSEINATGLRLKKLIKSHDRSVRIIPNKSPALNSAQVLHNQLTSPTGWELVLYGAKNKTYLGLTHAEQDIVAYSKRDQRRPFRDARVGMLPPKLAQIIINLSNPPDRGIVLDPFCGTGVILQEALLMDFVAYGSDIEQRMIQYSGKNLNWLKADGSWSLELGDATTHHWRDFDTVACETYLGRPLSRQPNPEFLHKIMLECDRIHRGFLENIAEQVKSGSRLCLAVPAWKLKNDFKHLPTLDKLKELGYTRIKFVHASDKDLLYFREDQYVARELVVLTKD